MQTINFPKPKLHLFVCINERELNHPTPSCSPRITPEQVKELKLWIRNQGLATQVYCTKAKCLGFCNQQASVAVLYPKGEFVQYQNIEELKQLIHQEL
tara:strand:- start:12476 stop:12769 length:294 start_codon:yes stop_codon:yes gene_type:complete